MKIHSRFISFTYLDMRPIWGYSRDSILWLYGYIWMWRRLINEERGTYGLWARWSTRTWCRGGASKLGVEHHQAQGLYATMTRHHVFPVGRWNKGAIGPIKRTVDVLDQGDSVGIWFVGIWRLSTWKFKLEVAGISESIQVLVWHCQWQNAQSWRRKTDANIFRVFSWILSSNETEELCELGATSSRRTRNNNDVTEKWRSFPVQILLSAFVIVI